MPFAVFANKSFPPENPLIPFLKRFCNSEALSEPVPCISTFCLWSLLTPEDLGIQSLIIFVDHLPSW